MGQQFLAEVVGTMVLIILGDGVVANVVLNKSKGQNSGWIVITTGWGLAVTMAVYAVGWISGAHINPAVSVGLAMAGKFPWASVPGYVAAQMLGAFIGAVIVWLAYKDHFAATEDADLKLAVFSTIPQIRNAVSNFLTEVIATFVLVAGVLWIFHDSVGITSWYGPIAVGFLVWSIGLSLGGPTGYAINPARDLGPRIAHALLPIPGKRDSDWGYAWIPVVAPIVGAILAAIFVNGLGLW